MNKLRSSNHHCQKKRFMVMSDLNLISINIIQTNSPVLTRFFHVSVNTIGFLVPRTQSTALCLSDNIANAQTAHRCTFFNKTFFHHRRPPRNVGRKKNIKTRQNLLFGHRSGIFVSGVTYRCIGIAGIPNAGYTWFQVPKRNQSVSHKDHLISHLLIYWLILCPYPLNMFVCSQP